MNLHPVAVARKGALAYIGAIALTGDALAQAIERLVPLAPEAHRPID